MSAPISAASSRSGAGGRELGTLARKWAYLVSMSSYIPLPHKEIERRMLDLAHEVFDTVATEPFDIDRAAAVGERLVKLHCVGRSSLRDSIDVLASGLMADERLRQVSGLGERVARTLGAMASGYADTVRWQTAEHQDGLSQALLEAVRNAEQGRRDRETECDEVVTELGLLRSQLNHQLLHDVLTALPNRQYFTTRLEHVLNTGSPTTVYHLEIDGLATICAGLGRPACANLLRIVADRLTGAVADAPAMVARLEEGRFGILVESTAPAPDPTPVVEAINAALAEPAHLDGLVVVLSVSTGVAQSPPHSHDPNAVLHASFLALQEAKRMGAGRWSLLEPSQDTGIHQEPRLAVTLSNAWWTGRVHVEFRPQIDLVGGRPVRLDALLRWDHAELGPLAHERCVALAEQVGLGERLGGWLLDRATERVRSWHGELPLTITLPPIQATNRELPSVIARCGLPAERLQVSVPAGLATGASVAGNLARLADAGVGVAVHDFGGAAGDVTCLSDVPVHAVRLAPELTRRSAERVIGHALRDMVALAHEAGAAVVVDDIWNETEADWWRDAGADIATGPVFPLPADFTLPAVI